MKILTKVISAFCVLALAGAFTVASTGVSEAAKKKAAAAAPTMGCVPFWVPVCGKKGKKSMTYSNACMAKAAGAKVSAQGECKKK
jgi:hypothetical protein